jgi:hypothetical protein
MCAILRVCGGTFMLAVVATAGIGCQQTASSSSGEPERLRPAARPYILDAPEPAGFELIDKLSEDHATPGWRYVRYTFKGRADRQAVLSYYREQLPLNKWTYLSRQSLAGEYKLLFEKPNEQCTVTIEPESGDWFSNGSRVSVVIRPLRRTGQMKDEGTAP